MQSLFLEGNLSTTKYSSEKNLLKVNQNNESKPTKCRRLKTTVVEKNTYKILFMRNKHLKFVKFHISKTGNCIEFLFDGNHFIDRETFMVL